MFDHAMFKFTQGEAAATDVQHRLLLEETLAAWTDASPSMDVHGSLTGKACLAQPEGPTRIALLDCTISFTSAPALPAGVYVGCMSHEYPSLILSTGASLPSQVG